MTPAFAPATWIRFRLSRRRRGRKGSWYGPWVYCAWSRPFEESEFWAREIVGDCEIENLGPVPPDDLGGFLYRTRSGIDLYAGRATEE
jgi:hypothetical protein